MTPTNVAECPSRACRSSRSRVFFAVACGLMVVGLSAPPASAHPTLITTIPQAGYAVAESPEEIGLVFDERVRLGPEGIALEGQARGDVETTAARLTGEGRITVRPATPLPRGRYTVRWQVIGEDGHTVEGAFGFGVGTSAPRTESGESGTPGLPASTVFRWMVFGGLCLALGGLAGDRLVRERIARAPPDRALEAPRPPLLTGSLAGTVGAAGLAVQQSGGGDILAGVKNLSLDGLVGSRPGLLLSIEFTAFAAAALAAIRPHRRMILLALLGVVVTEAARNHLGTRHGGWGTLTMGVHLLAVALWIGALVHVLRAGLRWRSARGQTRALFISYAAAALTLWLAVVATGTIAAVLLVPGLDELTGTDYGRLLLAKLGLVILAAGLATAARAHLRRPTAGQPFQPLARAEGAMLAAVLGLTGVLTSLGPPAGQASELAYPEPVRGPAVRLGGLAGQVTTGIIASADQLEVRLRVPEGDPGQRQPYTITATVTSPDGKRDKLPLRPCGTGCFVSPARWKQGENTVSLDVTAEGWHGGTARFTVPWPVHERPEILERVLQTLPRQPTVTITETVTSDTSRPTPPGGTFQMTGEELFDAEPYRSGVVGEVVELGRDGEQVEIGFAILAQDYYVKLVVGPDGRLVRERITSPGHVIWHEFAYPDR